MITDSPDQFTGLPAVSYVVPVVRDAEYLLELVRSIEQQDYPAAKVVIIAVAADSNLSPELAQELREARGVMVEFIANDTGSVAAGLNEAVAYSKTAIVIRVSSTTVLPPDYTSVAVSAITSTDAVLVGDRIRYRGTTAFEKAVARAYMLKIGRGSDPFVLEAPDGPSDGDSQAVFLRNPLIEAGLYDEDLRAGQDWELNFRLRTAGLSVWRTNRLTRIERPPRRLGTMTRALFADGLWRGQVRRQFPETPHLVYRVPVAIVIAVIATFILGAAGVFGIVAGTVGFAGVLTAVLSWLLLVPTAYVVGILALGVIIAAREGWRVGIRFLVVLPAIHFGWGLGFLLGYVRLDPPVREPVEE